MSHAQHSALGVCALMLSEAFYAVSALLHEEGALLCRENNACLQKAARQRDCDYEIE